MPIALKCSCGKVLKVKDELAGKKLKCPGCQAVVKVPAAAGNVTGGKKAKASAEDDADEAGGDGEINFNLLSKIEASGASLEEEDAAESGVKRPRGKRQKAAAAKGARGTQNSESSGSKTLIISVVCTAAGLALVMWILGLVLDPGKVEGPLQFDTFTLTELGGFKIQYPVGWEKKSGGGTGSVPPWATFTKGSLSISVRASQSGTAIGTIANPTGVDDKEKEVGGMDLAAVRVVHDWLKIKMDDEYKNYKELAAEPEKIKTGFGEGRLVEFTGEYGFSNWQGYRATFANNQWAYSVICKCPPGQFKTHQATFRQIILSMTQ